MALDAETCLASLKTTYLKCKVSIRLDMLLSQLMTKSKRDLRLRFQKKTLNAYSFREKEIFQYHDSGKKILPTAIQDMGDHWPFTIRGEKWWGPLANLDSVCGTSREHGGRKWASLAKKNGSKLKPNPMVL